MKYKKSELHKLEGPELLHLMENIKKMYKAIDDVGNEESIAIRKMRDIEKKVIKKAKFLVGKSVVGISFAIAVITIVLIWLMEFFYLYFAGKKYGANIFEDIPAEEIREIVVASLKGGFHLSLWIFAIAFIIIYAIKWKKNKSKSMDIVWKGYNDEYVSAQEERNKAAQKYEKIKEQGVYEIAQIIIPDSFQCYSEVCALIQAMNDNCVYNISQAIAVVKEERYRKAMLAEQRRQNEELARMARQQEEQARREAQHAQETERYNREMERLARDTAYAAKRTAEAEEEQARIARDMEWEYWHH